MGTTLLSRRRTKGDLSEAVAFTNFIDGCTHMLGE
jgi:hypothetical protein